MRLNASPTGEAFKIRRRINMSDFQNIFEYIIPEGFKMSKGQKKIAEYISNHYDSAAFMTAAKLGDAVGVSESTVVRFASELGFDGFAQFKKALGDIVKNKLTSVQKMEIISSKIGDEDVLKNVMLSDIEKLRQTISSVNTTDFEHAVDILLKAKTVYILGARTCFSLASFLEVYLNMLLENVKIATSNSASDVFEQMYRIGKNDALIAISYPRYSQRTLKGVKFAHERGADIISITDSPTSPIVSYSECSLIAGCDMSSIVDSLVAPLSLINALIVAIAMRNKERTARTFESLEDIWDKYNAYRNSEDS